MDIVNPCCQVTFRLILDGVQLNVLFVGSAAVDTGKYVLNAVEENIVTFHFRFVVGVGDRVSQFPTIFSPKTCIHLFKVK